MFKGKHVKTQVKNKDVVRKVIVFHNNKVCIKLGFVNYIEVVDNFDKGILYSKPDNNKYEPWTKKKVGRITNKHIVCKYWSSYKPGMKVQGIIVEKDDDKQFKVL